MKRFPIYSLFILFLNVAVILWGAYVRATGSGAGCGSHWPLCNGEVIPRAVEVETKIEFIHRLSSGLAFVGVVIQYYFARKIYGKGSAVERFASLALIFIIIEALIGAGLVLFEWVADNISVARAASISVHLINTLFLLAALTLTWWTSNKKDIHIQNEPNFPRLLSFLIPVLAVLIGVTGAIAALGDTLFPATSILEGIQQDFSDTAHILIRLRMLHPVFAVIGGVIVIIMFINYFLQSTSTVIKKLSIGVILLGGFQMILGFINVLLLAPVWMQIVHLFFADILWIVAVIFLTEVGAFKFLKINTGK